MPVEIDRSSLLKIARTKGEKGEGLPEWASGDQALTDAYYAGAGVPAPSPARETRPKPATSRPTSPKRSPAGAAARTAPPRSAPAGQSSTAGSSAASWKQRAVGRLTPGSAGGVMLAAFIYPVVLAALEAGPAGAVEWLKAKFLNDTPQSAQPSKPKSGTKIIAPAQSPIVAPGTKKGASA